MGMGIITTVLISISIEYYGKERGDLLLQEVFLEEITLGMSRVN